ncbi:MAG: hypothetical protein FJX73_12320 [Armatimonadetes bacterium]|nr:hypothetical protein [Armatimonadota bacterium]
MERTEFDALLDRLRIVERRLRLVFIVLALSLVAFVTLIVPVQQADSQPSTLRARAVEIVDEGGRRRITLDAVAGEPALRFWDATGTANIVLSAGPAKPGFLFLDAVQRSYVMLDPAGVLFVSPAGQASMGVDTRGPALWFVDSTGRVFYRIP